MKGPSDRDFKTLNKIAIERKAVTSNKQYSLR